MGSVNTSVTLLYLYGTPGTSYSQLVLAAQKAESESEETCERLRARTVVTTKPREVKAKLGQQFTQLMATLTQTKLGSSPTSATGSPQECGNTDGGAVGGAPQSHKPPQQ